MMQYLQGHSRLDITYTVSQCTKSTHLPRRCHEVALESIGQHLKGTVKEGLILKPTNDFLVDVFVDSDFAGLWPYEEREDQSCAKSRVGFVITVVSCPVIWNTKLIVWEDNIGALTLAKLEPGQMTPRSKH